jgi:exodeoxyribonuclease V beta subunit
VGVGAAGAAAALPFDDVAMLPLAGDTADEDTFAETVSEPSARAAAAPPADDARLHRFPRGPEAGTFLHDLLEWAAHEGFATAAAMPPAVRDALARRCALRGWPQWAAPLARWLQDFLTTPLVLPPAAEGGATVRLAALTTLQVELEFWFAARHVDTARLDALVRAHTLDGVARPALRAAELNGMLKGFVDLVFEHRGRYYVADYKSNWLGPDDGAYTREAMRAAVVDKRYDLQYVLYLFALHRLLKVRLPGYDYDRHVGGALYLFLRGSRAPTGGLHFERPPRALIDALDRLFAGAAAAPAAVAGSPVSAPAWPPAGGARPPSGGMSRSDGRVP